MKSLGSSHQYSRTSFKTSTRLQESALMTLAQTHHFPCRIIGTKCLFDPVRSSRRPNVWHKLTFLTQILEKSLCSLSAPSPTELKLLRRVCLLDNLFFRPYLKYHRRSHNRVSSMDSDPSRPASQPDVSRSNLQICTSREDGGSFSFSDLDPVQEATEGQEEPEDKK